MEEKKKWSNRLFQWKEKHLWLAWGTTAGKTMGVCVVSGSQREVMASLLFVLIDAAAELTPTAILLRLTSTRSFARAQFGCYWSAGEGEESLRSCLSRISWKDICETTLIHLNPDSVVSSPASHFCSYFYICHSRLTAFNSNIISISCDSHPTTSC